MMNSSNSFFEYNEGDKVSYTVKGQKVFDTVSYTFPYAMGHEDGRDIIIVVMQSGRRIAKRNITHLSK